MFASFSSLTTNHLCFLLTIFKCRILDILFLLLHAAFAFIFVQHMTLMLGNTLTCQELDEKTDTTLKKKKNFPSEPGWLFPQISSLYAKLS